MCVCVCVNQDSTNHNRYTLTADDVGCYLLVSEPVSFHGLITVSATEASLLDPDALPPELRYDISFGLFRRKLKSHLFV